MKSHLEESAPEFIKSLYQQNSIHIRDVSPLLLLEFRLLKELEGHDKNIEENIMEALFSLSMFVNYVNTELCCISRANFRTNLDAEKRYNLKHINCVILEAYKYLYGFKSGQKKSLWKTKIAPLLKLVDDEEFRKDFCVLDQKICQFGDSNFTDKDKRNLSFHYDLDPTTVYNHLIGISEEDEYNHLLHFNPLINDVLAFTLKYIQRHALSTNLIAEVDPKFTNPLVDLGQFSDDGNILYDTLQEVIDSHSLKLHQFVQHQSIPEKIKQLLKNDITDTILTLVELEKIVIQITYIYIDLASAISRFLTSEYALEKQFALKQINIIVYEGFNKLYSLNDSNQSFWQIYVVPFVTTVSDESILMEFELLNHHFETAKKEVKELDDQRQMSVHYDRGILKLYDMLYDLNPIVEISRSTTLLKLMPRVTNFLVQCLEVVKKRAEIENRKALEDRNSKIDKMINMLDKLPDDSFKGKVINDLQNLKSEKFFEEFFRNRSGN